MSVRPAGSVATPPQVIVRTWRNRESVGCHVNAELQTFGIDVREVARAKRFGQMRHIEERIQYRFSSQSQSHAQRCHAVSSPAHRDRT